MATMQRGTTVVLHGDEVAGLLEQLDEYANVRAAHIEGTDEDVQLWTALASEPYLVHDHDPLEHLASAWVEFFDDEITFDTLELEAYRAVRALESGAVELPDYYLVVAPEQLSGTWRHWWLGVLPEAAPTRVIPWQPDVTSIASLLRHLPTGRAWPAPRGWLDLVSHAVPDRVGLYPPSDAAPVRDTTSVPDMAPPADSAPESDGPESNTSP